MNNQANTISALFVLILMSALLTFGGTAIASSAEYCEAYANDRARSAAPGGGVIRGAARGSLGGAAIGGIANGRRGAGKGAAIGAIGGAIIGGARQANARAAAYDRAYYDCMRQERSYY